MGPKRAGELVRKKPVPPKHTQFKKGWKGGPGRPPDFVGRAVRQMAASEVKELATAIVRGNIEELEEFANLKRGNALTYGLAKTFIKAARDGNIFAMNAFLDRIIGKVPNTFEIVAPPVPPPVDPAKNTFQAFCEKAGYPPPFPKQIEMKDFIIGERDPRLLLGARGYGKTDYSVILGLAKELKEDPTSTTLIVTKSEERNSAIVEEIRKAAEADGVVFEKANASCLRVKGLIGKDHSISTVAIRTKSLRGRHPKRVIMDDPVTEEDASEATRKHVQRVYNELHKLCSNIAVIGQPVHKLDLYGTLRPLLRKMEVPHGSIPELDADLAAQRAAGVSEESIQASYFLKVVAENPSPLEGVKYLPDFPKGDSAVAFIDPSFEGGDFTALTILKAHFGGVAVKGHVYKKAWYHCIPEMQAHMAACNVKRICFETNSLGDQPIVMLREAMPGIGVMGKKSTGHKHSRIVAAGAYAHLIHLAKTSDQKYIEQVTQYEYGAKNDDAPDSLASCLEWVGLIRGKQKS